MNTDSKPIWQSKLFWLGAVTALIAALNAIAESPLLTATQLQWVLLIVGVLTAVLRTVTTQPVTFMPPADEEPESIGEPEFLEVPEEAASIAAFAAPMLSTEMTSFELEIGGLINLERQRKGIRPVEANGQLAYAAAVHSGNMARTGRIQHNLWGTDTPTMLHRAAHVGYRPRALAENIAYGYATAEAVVSAWMGSSGHRANILNPHVKDIGVGVAPRRGRMCFTLFLGAPR